MWTGRSFFVWTSVFNLFITSLFWCFMADVFRSAQAKRLFGFIGVGGHVRLHRGERASPPRSQRASARSTCSS